MLAAVPAREDIADALIAPRYQTLTALPIAARIGTSSPRRRAQLLFFRPDLEIVSLRGNVETRLNRHLKDGSTPWSWPGQACIGSGLDQPRHSEVGTA